MKIQYRACDICDKELKKDSESKKGIFRNGRSIYFRYGLKFKRMDICLVCLNNLETVVNQQLKKELKN